jgi:hypothetical protein
MLPPPVSLVDLEAHSTGCRAVLLAPSVAEERTTPAAAVGPIGGRIADSVGGDGGYCEKVRDNSRKPTGEWQRREWHLDLDLDENY